MRENISVRQWQAMYRLGAFSGKDTATQCEAGWYDWFCRDDSLAGRLKQIAPAVMGITDPFILDNFYVWFKNNCPCTGPLRHLPPRLKTARDKAPKRKEQER